MSGVGPSLVAKLLLQCLILAPSPLTWGMQPARPPPAMRIPNEVPVYKSVTDQGVVYAIEGFENYRCAIVVYGARESAYLPTVMKIVGSEYKRIRSGLADDGVSTYWEFSRTLDGNRDDISIDTTESARPEDPALTIWVSSTKL
jgi:hypothetical protein